MIFLTQGSNLGLPHYREILYRLSLQGNPINSNKTYLNIVGKFAQVRLTDVPKSWVNFVSENRVKLTKNFDLLQCKHVSCCLGENFTELIVSCVSLLSFCICWMPDHHSGFCFLSMCQLSHEVPLPSTFLEPLPESIACPSYLVVSPEVSWSITSPDCAFGRFCYRIWMTALSYSTEIWDTPEYYNFLDHFWK